ncbi:hypothetical protein O6P43_022799 [Quillaja saponaria]|uniref:Uncharacterized protein n=1 Tax=Quillaja saponaria TaxID=32244 RepID=A0AAD7PIP7_QUISA|nr:hypothetical protein O6P43_022799 [Quillaja saponaria]
MASDAQDKAVAKYLMLDGASVKNNSNMPAKVKRSAEPRNKYCIATHKKVIGRGSAESNIWDSAATFLRLISTVAATAIATMERTNPVPIRCR